MNPSGSSKMKKAFRFYFVPSGTPASQRQTPSPSSGPPSRTESQVAGSSSYGRSVGHSASSPSSTTGPLPPRASLPPNIPFRIGADAGFSIVDVKNDMMVNWLYEQQLRKQYASGLDQVEGVVLKKARGDFTCFPPELQADPTGLFAMVVKMNVRVRRYGSLAKIARGRERAFASRSLRSKWANIRRSAP